MLQRTCHTEELIDSYLSEVRKEPAHSDEVINVLNNIIKRQGLRVPKKPLIGSIISNEKMFRPDIRIVNAYFFLNDLPEGINHEGDHLNFDSFEQRHLTPLGYNIVETNIYETPVDSKKLQFWNPKYKEYRGETESFVSIDIRSFKLNYPYQKWTGDKDDEGNMIFRRVRPEKLYHLAPTELESKILREGLKPRRKTFGVSKRSIEPRVYLWHEIDRHVINMIMSSVHRHERPDIDTRPKTKNKTMKFTAFEIDMDKFDRFNVYYDQMLSDHASYTKTHIPPHALKIYKRMRIPIYDGFL